MAEEIESKNGNPLISVIIPCYNSEKFIQKTIGSIVSQTVNNIEIICVNDGSSDQTLNVLKQIRCSTPQLKIIDKKNEGIEFAIKDAVIASHGDYIFLLGHDDWLSEKALEEGLKAFYENQELDAVRMDLFFILGDNTIRNTLEDRRILSGEQAVLETIGGWKIHTFCLWKREIFTKVLDIGTEGMLDFDEYATRYLYSLCRKVGFCEGRYYYLQHNESVSNKRSLRRIDIVKTDTYIRKMLIRMKIYDRCSYIFEKRAFFRLFIGFCIFHAFPKKKEQYDKYIKILKEGYSSLNKAYLYKDKNFLSRFFIFFTVLNFKSLSLSSKFYNYFKS